MDLRSSATAGAIAALLLGLTHAVPAVAVAEAPPGLAGRPYEDMPAIAPIGVRVDRYLPVPPENAGRPIDPAKGYRLEPLGRGLYMVSDDFYQSMLMVHSDGVIVIDAPPRYSKRLRAAIAEVTDRPVTHVVYSHAHSDHIGGVTDLGGRPVLVAQEETARLLKRAGDPRRPVPTLTFKDRYTLEVGGQKLELSYPGVGHQAGNIFVYAPEQKALMVVDVVFPGWMPWRRFALAEDVTGFFQQVAEIDRIPFRTLVAGHVSRIGTHDDVKLQLAFMNDLKAAAAEALRSTEFGADVDPADKANPWAVSDNFIDRVALRCVNALAPGWQSKLAAFDVYIWDQCYAMEQSLRID